MCQTFIYTCVQNLSNKKTARLPRRSQIRWEEESKVGLWERQKLLLLVIESWQSSTRLNRSALTIFWDKRTDRLRCPLHFSQSCQRKQQLGWKAEPPRASQTELIFVNRTCEWRDWAWVPHREEFGMLRRMAANLQVFIIFWLALNRCNRKAFIQRP